MRNAERDFEALDAAVYGVSVEDVETLRAFRERLRLPYTLLSDPLLTTASALDLPVSSPAAYATTAAIHPSVLRYPKKAFLQPAMLVWSKTDKPIYEWRQTEKLRNLFGATGRPSAQQMLDVLRGLET